MAYSRLVDCDAIGTGGRGWKCDRGRPRAYLTIPDQEFEVVITDELDRETAIALIDFARLRLQEEANYADLDDWKFTLIRVPDQSLEAFLVAGSDVAYGSISFAIKEAEIKETPVADKAPKAAPHILAGVSLLRRPVESATRKRTFA